MVDLTITGQLGRGTSSRLQFSLVLSACKFAVASVGAWYCSTSNSYKCICILLLTWATFLLSQRLVRSLLFLLSCCSVRHYLPIVVLRSLKIAMASRQRLSRLSTKATFSLRTASTRSNASRATSIRGFSAFTLSQQQNVQRYRSLGGLPALALSKSVPSIYTPH